MVGAELTFVILDDGTLSIYSSLDAIRRDLEAIDIFERSYRFFNSRGQPLSPAGERPKTGKLMGMTWVGGGNLRGFELVTGLSLFELLPSVSRINANPHLISFETVKAYLGRQN